MAAAMIVTITCPALAEDDFDYDELQLIGMAGALDGYGEYEAELIILKHLAAQHPKHGGSAYFIGEMYALGKGVAQNDTEATRWYRLSAENDYDMSAYKLSTAYKEGRGIKRDPAQAMLWLKRAASGDMYEAQEDLGFAYAKGDGVRKDYPLALMWLTLETGHIIDTEPLSQARASLQTEMTDQEIAREKALENICWNSEIGAKVSRLHESDCF